MIQRFVEAWDRRKDEIRKNFTLAHPESYEGIVKSVVEILGTDSDTSEEPDPERIQSVDYVDYQGTMLFVIGGKGYQPRDYWYVKVDYGSCPGCDTFEAIRWDNGYDSSIPPTEQQVEDYMQLALHILQGIKSCLGDE